MDFNKSTNQLVYVNTSNFTPCATPGVAASFCWEDTIGYLKRTTFALFCVETVLIILLNSLVIKSCLHRRRWKSRLYFFLLHLAIADLLVGIFMTFPHVIEEIADDWPVKKTWLCKVVKSLGYSSLHAAIYILTAMSIDRTLVVVNPIKHFAKGRMTQWITVAFCWVLGLLLNIPTVSFNTIIEIRGKSYCVLYIPDDVKWFSHEMSAWGGFAFELAIPSIIIIASFSTLICVLYGRTPGSVRGSGALARPSVGIFNSGLPRTKVKSIKLTFGIVSTYIICWLPRYVFRLGQQTRVFSCSPVSGLIVPFIFFNNMANPTLFFVFQYNRKSKPTGMTARQTGYSQGLVKSANNRTVTSLQDAEVGTGSTRTKMSTSSTQLTSEG